MTLDDTPSSRWVRHNRMRYVAMYVAQIIEIERVGKRWHITMTNIFTGEVTSLETRSTLSVATRMAETAAEEIGSPYKEKED